jgi:hypothetical protein
MKSHIQPRSGPPLHLFIPRARKVLDLSSTNAESLKTRLAAPSNRFNPISSWTGSLTHGEPNVARRADRRRAIFVVLGALALLAGVAKALDRWMPVNSPEYIGDAPAQFAASDIR